MNVLVVLDTVGVRPFNRAGVNVPDNMLSSSWRACRALLDQFHAAEFMSSRCSPMLMPAATAACYTP